jgi:hypothetical protein
MAALFLSTRERPGYSRSAKKARLGEVGDGKRDGAAEEKTNRIFSECHKRLQANDGSSNSASDTQMDDGEGQQRAGFVEQQSGDGADKRDARADRGGPRRIEDVKTGLRSHLQVEVAGQVDGAQDEQLDEFADQCGALNPENAAGQPTL